MLRRNRRKEKGITLITLVVTIIVLVILAGVSLGILVGDNGILTQTQQIRGNVIFQGEEQQLLLNQLYWEMEQGKIYSEDEESAKKDQMIELLQKQVEELKQQIADLQGELDTTKEQLTSLQEEYNKFKEIIALAITNKGVPTAPTDSAETMAANIEAIPSTSQNISIAQTVTATGGGYDEAYAGYTETIVLNLEGFSTITFSSLSNMSSITCNGTSLGNDRYDISGLTSVTITATVSNRRVANQYGGVRYGSVTGSYTYTLEKENASGKLNSMQNSITATGGGYDCAWAGYSQSTVVSATGLSKVTLSNMSNLSSTSCDGTSLGDNSYDISALSSTTISSSISTRQVVNSYGGIKYGSVSGSYVTTFE